MKILICGGSGFVGRHLAERLDRQGHEVVRAIRRPMAPSDIAVDFSKDIEESVWLPRLKGMQVVINAVGVLRDGKDTPMQRLHAQTPAALYSASAKAGVGRVVHISALGVDGGIDVPYFSTKRIAEQALFSKPMRWLCIRPSVIYGEDGASAAMFRRMAALPMQVLPMGGIQQLQPVHIDDICDAVSSWLENPDAKSLLVDAVGAEPTTMRGMLDSYREQMKRRPAWHVALPSMLVRLAALIGDFIPASPMCSDTYAMLSAGSTADPAGFENLLGRKPKSYREFITGHPGEAG